LNLTYAACEEANEQFGSGVRDIERDHQEEPLHKPVSRPNVAEDGENEGGEGRFMERGGGLIVMRGPVEVVVQAVCGNVYRRVRWLEGRGRVRMLEGRLARKGESAIGGAAEAEIAVDGSERLSGFLHLGNRKRSREEKENNGIRLGV